MAISYALYAAVNYLSCGWAELILGKQFLYNIIFTYLEEIMFTKAALRLAASFLRRVEPEIFVHFSYVL